MAVTTLLPQTISYDRRRLDACQQVGKELRYIKLMAIVVRDVQRNSAVRAGAENFVMAMFLADRLVKAVSNLCDEYNGS